MVDKIDKLRMVGNQQYVEYAAYRNLAAEIVLKAVDDWNRLCRVRIDRTTVMRYSAMNGAQMARQGLGEFFTSEWCASLIPTSPADIIARMTAVYNKSKLKQSIVEMRGERAAQLGG